MALIKSLIGTDKYSLKCPYPMTPKGVIIHNTANDASAENEINYMKTNNSDTSFHIAIDDTQAVQGLPLNRNAWANGDGANGEGNRNYISIEICYSKSGGDKFFEAEKRTAKEVALLLKEYNWTTKNVKKHQDFAKKNCPHRTLEYGWDRFLKMIDVELSKLNPEPKEEVNNVEKIVEEYREIGRFTCTEDMIYFRNKPIIEQSNKIQGSYTRGESVNYDNIIISNLYVYISWVSLTGTRRYMPVREVNNGVYGELWGTIK